MSMSDAAGALFNFRRKNKDEDDTAPHVSTGDIPQVFAPTPTGAVPRHAAENMTLPKPEMLEDGDEKMDEETERAKALALAQSLSFPFVDLNEYQIDDSVMKLVPDDLCRRNNLLPLSIINGRLTVAMADPKNFSAIDDVSAIAMVAMPSQVQESINRHLRANAELDEISHEVAVTAKKEIDLEKDDAEASSPVTRFVTLLITRPSTTTAPISTSNRRRTACSSATASTAYCTCSSGHPAP